MRRPLIQLVAALLLVGGGVWAVTGYVARPWLVRGPSMEPTLRDGDRLIVDLRAYRTRPAAAGELVLVSLPELGTLVKRVERSDGERLWLSGDNPSASLDSRQLGPVAQDRLLGRVWIRYWPPGRVGRPPGR